MALVDTTYIAKLIEQIRHCGAGELGLVVQTRLGTTLPTTFHRIDIGIRPGTC